MAVKELVMYFKDQFDAAVVASEMRLMEDKERVEKLAALDVEIEAEKKVQFDLGFDEGLKQVSAPGEKTFSLEELNAEIAAAKAPLEEQIAALAGQIVELGAQVEVAKGQVVDLTGKVEAAIAEKAILSSEFDAMKVEFNAASLELATVKADLQAKVNLVFEEKLAEVKAKFDELEEKEMADVEQTKVIRSALDELVAPVVIP